MKSVISIGNHDFISIRENHCFYIDKTDFIREWWENQDSVTLITRPRRFGKTLNKRMYPVTGESLRLLFEAYLIPHLRLTSIWNGGLLTGITRVSKESIFSDLNNLEVVTTTLEKYSSSFSFREGQQGQEKSQKHRSHWKGDSK